MEQNRVASLRRPPMERQWPEPGKLHPLIFCGHLSDVAVQMNAETERQHFDALMAHLGILPESVTRPDPPDFAMLVDRRKINVEHTLAVFEEVARGFHLRDSEQPSAFLNLTSLRDGGRRRPSKDIRPNITHPTNPTVRPIKVEDRLKEWVEKILNSVDRKRSILNQGRYAGFDENWLLVVDYPPRLDTMTVNIVLPPLRAGLLRTPPGTPLDFYRVYIRSGRYWLHWEDRRLICHESPI
jgi:hypothetical protein